MKAIHVRDDENNTLVWEDHPRPEPGPEEVRLRIRATAVNRADLLQRRGLYPPPEGATEVMGLEAAGRIEACGEAVSDWSSGDRACALLPGGGYAEYVTVPRQLLLEVPDAMAWTDAAAIPEVFYTAYLNLFREAELTAGESALIHAGASGVGTAAIQLCRLRGCPVFATASAPKLEFLRELGAEDAIDRKTQCFAQRIADATDGAGVDVILDPVAGGYLEDNLDTLASRGRLVIIGLLGGSRDELPLGRLLVNRLKIIGSVLRSRSLSEKAAITAGFRKEVWPYFESGRLEPIIHEAVPITEVERAHDFLHANATIGKVVLTVD